MITGFFGIPDDLACGAMKLEFALKLWSCSPSWVLYKVESYSEFFLSCPLKEFCGSTKNGDFGIWSNGSIYSSFDGLFSMPDKFNSLCVLIFLCFPISLSAILLFTDKFDIRLLIYSGFGLTT